MFRRSTLLTLGLLASGGVLATGSFALVRYATDDSGAVAQPGQATEQPGAVPTSQPPPPPGPERPVPGATPDLRQPFWYVPYTNRDQTLPVFEGTLNGIEIGRTAASPADEGYCGDAGRWVRDPAEAASYADSTVGIPPTLPTDMSFIDAPIYLICDGVPTRTETSVKVAVDREAPAANPELGIGYISVTRFRGTPHTPQRDPAERWSAGKVAGLPAAILRPVVESVGGSTIVVHDPATGVTTTVRGQGVYVRSLERLLEEILR